MSDIRIWKISHGWRKSAEIEERSILLAKQTVATHRECGRLPFEQISQGDNFCDNVKKGDYLYLCYSSKIILFGQFVDDELIPSPSMCRLHDNKEKWYERRYRIIAESSDNEHSYTDVKKSWAPNFNSTFIRVKDSELPLFEKVIMKPYFDLSLKDLK